MFQIAFSSAVVRQSTHVFCLLTTTERPSLATVNAIHFTPASRQRIASEFRIGREALARSVSLRQKRSKPPPVPEMPTVTRACGLLFWKPSAAAIAYGPTVLEPSAVTVPPSGGHAGGRRRGEHGGREDRECDDLLHVSPLSSWFMLSTAVSGRPRRAWAERR